MQQGSELPNFKYHLDPVKSEVVVKSDVTCLSCKQSRGYIYTGPVYSNSNLDESICPWCIANGEAAKKFKATFSDPYNLLRHKISDEIVKEVTERTPGYISWQSETWLSHCNDACEFLGDASKDDVFNAAEETKRLWIAEYDANEDFWNMVIEGYEPKGHNAFYKFKCRHCDLILLGWDSG